MNNIYLIATITGILLFNLCHNEMAAQEHDFTIKNLVTIGGGNFQMGQKDQTNLGIDVIMSSFRMAKFKTTNREFILFLNSISEEARYRVVNFTHGNGANTVIVEMLVVTYHDKDIICVVSRFNRRERYSEDLRHLPANCSAIKYNFGVQPGGKFYSDPQFEMYPVMGVTWEGANEYCLWLSKRLNRNINLPSEAQWEYANIVKGGNFKIPYRAAHSSMGGPSPINISHSHLTLVGQQENVLGLISVHDMNDLGPEYCSDYYSSEFTLLPREKDPKGPLNGTYRVIRFSDQRLGAEEQRQFSSFSTHLGHSKKPSTPFQGLISFRIIEEI